MNFDVVIIGGGLAGLTCGIALQEQGKRCVIINNGQAAIDFASGSLDLLSRLPNGAFVKNIPENLTALSAQIDDFSAQIKLLQKAIIETPPLLIRDGGVIAEGYNAELDEWRTLSAGATKYLENLEQRERESTGIDTLKLALMRCMVITFKSAKGKLIKHRFIMFVVKP